MLTSHQVLESELKTYRNANPSALSTQEQESLKAQLVSKYPNANLDIYNAKVYAELLPYARQRYLQEQKGSPEEQAYKLAVLFDDSKKALDYVQKYLQQHKESTQLLSEACSFSLPQKDFDIAIWRKLSQKFLAEDIFRNTILPQACEVEALIKSQQSKKKLSASELKNISTLTKEVDALNAKFKKSQRKHGSLTVDEKAAQDKLSQELANKRKELTSAGIAFNDQLTLTALSAFREKTVADLSEAYNYFIKQGLTKHNYAEFASLQRQDNDVQIPNIAIDGASIGHPGYYLKKVDVMNELEATKAACFGKLIGNGCCQSLSGENGHACTIHGLTSPNGGFYIICQGDANNPHIDDPLLAGSWTWRSKNAAICFDSIEMKRADIALGFFESQQEDGHSFQVTKDFYQHLTNKLIEKHTDKVICGNSSGISRYVGEVDISKPEEFIDYNGYCDSKAQRVLYDKNAPFYNYGKDTLSSQATEKMIHTVLSNPSPLLKYNNFATALNWALLDQKNRNNLIEKIVEITKNSYPERIKEVENTIENMKSCIEGSQYIKIADVENDAFFIDMKLQNGKTALVDAIMNKQYDLAKILIDKGAQININTQQHHLMYGPYTISPLCWLISNLENEQDVDLVLHLIQAGADVNARGGIFNSPPLILNEAVEKNPRIRQALIEAGADLNAKDSNGHSALTQQIINGDLQAAQELIKIGADVHVKNFRDQTLIFMAKNNETIIALKEKGLDINAKDNNGNTALMVRAKDKESDGVMLMLENGADVNIKNENGLTVFEIADKNLKNQIQEKIEEIKLKQKISSEVKREVKLPEKRSAYVPSKSAHKVSTINIIENDYKKLLQAVNEEGPISTRFVIRQFKELVEKNAGKTETQQLDALLALAREHKDENIGKFKHPDFEKFIRHIKAMDMSIEKKRVGPK